MSSAAQIFAQFPADLATGLHDLSADEIYVALSDTLPDAQSARTLADIAEIGTGNGYVAGGVLAATGTYASGTLTLNDAVFTASGGPMNVFQYLVLYNNTVPAQPLIAFYDYGGPVALNSSDVFSLSFDPTGAIVVG